MTVKELITELKKIDENLEVINYEGFNIMEVQIEPNHEGGFFAVIY